MEALERKQIGVVILLAEKTPLLDFVQFIRQATTS